MNTKHRPSYLEVQVSCGATTSGVQSVVDVIVIDAVISVVQAVHRPCVLLTLPALLLLLLMLLTGRGGAGAVALRGAV